MGGKKEQKNDETAAKKTRRGKIARAERRREAAAIKRRLARGEEVSVLQRAPLDRLIRHVVDGSVAGPMRLTKNAVEILARAAEEYIQRYFDSAGAVCKMVGAATMKRKHTEIAARAIIHANPADANAALILQAKKNAKATGAASAGQNNALVE